MSEEPSNLTKSEKEMLPVLRKVEMDLRCATKMEENTKRKVLRIDILINGSKATKLYPYDMLGELAEMSKVKAKERRMELSERRERILEDHPQLRVR